MHYLCPHDNRILQPKLLHGGRSYVCPECNGEMVNVGVLKRDPTLVKGVSALWDEARDTTNDEGVRCPQCNRLMTRTRIPQTGERIDVCKPCQAVWLDRGEYDIIPRTPPPPPPPPPKELPVQAVQSLASLEMEANRERRKRGGYTGTGPLGQWKAIPMLLRLPVEDEDMAIDKFPVVSWFIVLVSVAIFLAFHKVMPYLISDFGFLSDAPFRHFGTTTFISFFLHWNWLHLVLAMYFLMMLGDNCEVELGPKLYIMMLASGHVLGLLVAGMFLEGWSFVIAGANAGIGTVLAFYTIRYPTTPFGVLGFIIFLRGGNSVFDLPAWALFGFWVWLHFVYIMIAGGYGGGAGALSNIAGILVGLVWALGLPRKDQPAEEQNSD